MFAIPLHRMNKIASAAILPMMVLAIVMSSRLLAKEAAPAMPAEGTLVVANLRAQSLTVRDMSTGEVRELALPGPPHEVAVAGGRVYVTLGRADAVAEVDVGGPSVTRLLSLEGTPHGLAIAGDTLFVTLESTGRLARVDRASFAPGGSEATGDTPHAVAVAGPDIFVTDSRDGRLRQLPSGVTLQTGAMPESVVAVGAFVVTADNLAGTLTVFTAEPFARVGQMALGGGPVRVIGLDERRVLVALSAGGELAVVDLGARKVERRVKVAGRPDGLCLSPDGEFVAVASNATAAVQVFRVKDWRLAGTMAAGDGPGACAWLPAD
ncbi:MAG: hypothetical protein C0506_10395 [Anaerolinea sp.]|nr:hypothetical protein [Anaerolinea sp.]